MPKKKDCRSTGVACGQYKDKEGETDKNCLIGPGMSIFYFLLSQETTIPKIGFNGRKCGQGGIV